MKRITIKDLADLLQISTSTVSRALSNHPDISDAVKKRVKEAAETFNYIPNDFAINFRKKSTKVIGLIIPKMSMFFIPSIIEGISAKFNKEGYKFFILSSEESLEIEKENLQTCANSRVDGVLISLTSKTQDFAHFKKLDDFGIPVVLFDKSLSEQKYDQVVFNNEKDAEECAKKLVHYQCKNILAIFGDKDLEITEKRRKSFENYLNNYSEINYKSIFCDSAEMVKEKLEIILEYEKFDGIFAMSDETLAGLNYALKIRGLSAKPYKIIAISEGIFPKYLNPHYEFIKNDGIKMGMMAASILLEKIKNSDYKNFNTYYI
jgi:LacI family transcriptional regulator